MVECRGGRQHHKTAIDWRQGRGRQPCPAQWCRHLRQVVGREGPRVALPQQARHVFERGAARQRGDVVASIVEAAVLDQGQRRFEHRRAEVERVIGDRLGLAADIASSFQALDVVGAVALLAASFGRLGAQQAAADIGVERRRRHAESPGGVLGTHEFVCHDIILINVIKIDNT